MIALVNGLVKKFLSHTAASTIAEWLHPREPQLQPGDAEVKAAASAALSKFMKDAAISTKGFDGSLVMMGTTTANDVRYISDG